MNCRTCGYRKEVAKYKDGHYYCSEGCYNIRLETIDPESVYLRFKSIWQDIIRLTAHKKDKKRGMNQYTLQKIILPPHHLIHKELKIFDGVQCLSKSSVCELFNKKRTCVDKWVSDGYLKKYLYFDGRLYYRLEDILAFIEWFNKNKARI